MIVSRLVLVFVVSATVVFAGAFASARTGPAFTSEQIAIASALPVEGDSLEVYKARSFRPIWSGPDAELRREALLRVLDEAQAHGLPTVDGAGRYAAAAARATTDRPAGGADVALTTMLLDYARSVSGGVVAPSAVDAGIKRSRPERDWVAWLETFLSGEPGAALAALPPRRPAYIRLLREKLRLEAVRAEGGWGPDLRTTPLQPGDSGIGVAALRDRLIRMGYMGRTRSALYDEALTAAVRTVQADLGIEADGVARTATLEALNVPVDERIGQIIVGLERLRWTAAPSAGRRILVNLAEFRAYVLDDGRTTFETDVVIGKDVPDRRTPEFSDVMDHIVINPSWYVPRSIAVKEYLPKLRRGGARHLEVYSRRGRVNPAKVDFRRYTARSFPYSLRQPPGPRNALGAVKFMFPNEWNIYLHDTPAKSLFSHEVRAYSHGCVRVARPADLARHLLAAQEADPDGLWSRVRASGRERRIDLERPVPVDIVYRSVWVTPEGHVNYRGDPYGRDAKLLDALREAGVVLGAGEG
jgi:murein L,D-transpeptidase YcbB/YkuD